MAPAILENIPAELPQVDAEKTYKSLRAIAVEAVWKTSELEQQIKVLTKAVFGEKKEKYVSDSDEQLLLKDMDGYLTEEEARKETKTTVPEHKRTKKKKKLKPKRQILPSHLPRKETVIEPVGIPENKEGYIKVGEEVSEHLEMVEAKYYVERTIRPKYKKIETGEFSCASAPNRLFEKHLVGQTVISNILTSKYADHLPLYRISKMFFRDGLDISRSTMVGWIAYACVLLEPIYQLMINQLSSTRLVQADESHIPVLAPSKVHRGYMWVYVMDKKYTVFDYRRGRSREGPTDFLKDFSGVLQTDGYDGYNQAVEMYELIHLGCMAHARRKFHEAFKFGENISEKALEFIGELYDIERELKELSATEEEILKRRQWEALPILEEFKGWANTTASKVVPKSATGKAIGYFLNEYSKLRRYIDNPNADIDNNICEREIRPMTIGRKNYLFAGSEEGAKRMAIMYSIIMTCRIHNLDPKAYFNAYFSAIEKNSEIEIKDLMPNTITI